MKKNLKRLGGFFILLVMIFAGLCIWQPSVRREEPTAAVIVGYNFFLEYPETARHYVARIVPILAEYRDLRLIIVSGGRTKLHKSLRSEAEVLKEELARQGIEAPILLEEQARTTKENLRYTGALLEKFSPTLPAGTEIIIFSDQLSRPKVQLLAPRYFHGRRISFFGISTWWERMRVAWLNRG